MPLRKRSLLWDWTNTHSRPWAINQLFPGPPGASASSPFVSVHNWNVWPPPELAGRLPFRPMLRTLAQTSGADLVSVAESPAEVVHFLNEPERQGVTAEQAAEAWDLVVVPELVARKGKRVVGPACASDALGQAWLAQWFSLVQHSPDFLGLHYCGTSSSDAKEYLVTMHCAYKLPVIVSEIASVSRDAHQVQAFTMEMCRWMDEQEWVVEYGFFGCMAGLADDFVSPAAQLMDAHGNFTALMRRLAEPPEDVVVKRVCT